MRKAYMKPRIVFESFIMSTSIATGCEEKTNLLNAEQNCGFEPDPTRQPGWVVFSEEQACSSTPPSQYDSLCYHVPEESYNLFTS